MVSHRRPAGDDLFREGIRTVAEMINRSGQRHRCDCCREIEQYLGEIVTELEEIEQRLPPPPDTTPAYINLRSH